MATSPLSIQDFAAKIREKHPGSYDGIPDAELTDKVLAKYPQYSDMVTKASAKAAPPQEPGILAKGFDAANKAASALIDLSPIPLPKGFGDVPNWAQHMLGIAPDSKPAWDNIHEAVKNPTQENLVKAVPIFGPAGVAASQDARSGHVGNMLLDLIKPTAQAMVGGATAGLAKSGLAARGVEAADKARISAASDLNKAIPATKSTPYTPEDVQRAQPYLSAEHADKPVTSVQELKDSADSAIKKVEDRVSSAIQQSPMTYRARPVGQQGIPPSATPTATGSLAKAQQYAENLKEMTGQEHEVVQVPTDGAQAHAGPNGETWHSFPKGVPEERVEKWTSPLENVKAVLSKNARGQSFVKAGLKDLEDFRLDEPKTLGEMDDIRRQLNAENSAILRKNSYDINTARKADAGFAAREAASEALRNGIYDQLEKQGFDARGMRQDEGSLIKVRNAAQNQIFNAEKKVTGTGGNRLGAQLLAGGVGAGVGTGVGSLLDHPGIGALVGGKVGEQLGRLFKAENLTRNELIERSFSTPQGNPTPFGPTVQPPVGGASIGDILRAKGLNPLQLNQQQVSPALPFHPGAGLQRPGG